MSEADYARLASALLPRTTVPLRSLGPQATAYQPTFRDRIASALMGPGRASREKEAFVGGLMGSRGIGSTGMSVVDATPMGLPLALNEAGKTAYSRGLGDPQTGFETAMAVVPGASGGRRAVRDVAAEVERELQKMGFKVRADHGGSIAGDSSYLTPTMETPFGPMYSRQSVRVSDHSTGPKRHGEHLHINSDNPDMAVLDSLRQMASDINARVERLSGIRSAIEQNPALVAEIAKLPKDIGRSYKLAKQAGVNLTADDMAVVLRAMNK